MAFSMGTLFKRNVTQLRTFSRSHRSTLSMPHSYLLMLASQCSMEEDVPFEVHAQQALLAP